MTQPKDFGFDDDAAMLRDTARKFLADSLPTDKLHRLVAANSDPYRTPACDWDQSLWRQIVELGWTTVAVPEAAGGIGMNLAALVKRHRHRSDHRSTAALGIPVEVVVFVP